MLFVSTFKINSWTKRWETNLRHMSVKDTKEATKLQSNTRCSMMKKRTGRLTPSHTIFGTIKFEMSKLKTIQ